MLVLEAKMQSGAINKGVLRTNTNGELRIQFEAHAKQTVIISFLLKMKNKIVNKMNDFTSTNLKKRS